MDTIKVEVPKYFRSVELNECRCHFVDAFCRYYENNAFIKGAGLSSDEISSVAYVQSLLYCLIAREFPKNKKVISLPESCRYTFLIEGKKGYPFTVAIINKVWDCFIWSYQQNEGGIDDIIIFYRLVGLRDALIEFVTCYFSEWLATRNIPETAEEKPFV